MKKWILLLAALFTVVEISYSAEPILELPPQPTGKQLELFEDSDELFALELMKYYNYALTYQIQYMLFNPVEEITKRVPEPTLEQITDAEAKTLAFYYRLAKYWHDKVVELPDDLNKKEVNELREKLLEARKQMDQLERKLFRMKYGYSQRQLDSIRSCNRELYNSTYMPDSECDPLNSSPNNQNGNYYPLFTASFEGNLFFSGDDGLESELSAGTFITLNTAKLLGLGKHFEVFFSYVYPKFNTIHNINIETKWNLDLYSLGANLTFNDLIVTRGFNAGVKIGGGFFWADGYADNVYNSSFEADGGVIRAELTLSKFNKYVPMEIYLAYTGYLFSDNLSFNEREYRIEFDQSYLQSFSFGLRFVLWKGYQE